MPRRKRRDPIGANIIGDPQHDQVLNPRPGKSYWHCSDEDMPTALARGYVRVEVTPNGPRPATALEAKDGAGYRTNGQLTLMEIDTERRDAIQRMAEGRFNAQLHGNRQAAREIPEGTQYVSFEREKGFNTQFKTEAR